MDRIIYKKDGVWHNKGVDNKRSTSTHPTQKQAEQAARKQLNESGGGELITKGVDGIGIGIDGIPTKELFNGMKFDVVVGNPPYQECDNNNTITLWPKFVSLSITLSRDGGHVGLVTPDTWRYNSMYSTITQLDVNVISLDVAKYFPGVGSTFSYYIVTNSPSSSTKRTTLITETDNIAINLPEVGLFTSDVRKLKILSKLKGDNQPTFTRVSISTFHTTKLRKGDPTVSQTQTETHRYPVIHKITTPNTYFYTSELDAKQFNVPRVILSTWTAKYEQMFVSSETSQTCEQFSHFIVDTYEEAQILKTVLLSNVYKFIIHSFKDTKSLTAVMLSQFPKVDLNRPWTDAELYAHFNLTEEEIDLIEGSI